MRKDLREIAINSAAARYGSEHYRSILFWLSVGKYVFPALGIAALVVGAWWVVAHVITTPGSMVGLSLLLTVAGVGLLYLGIRRIRSPYRRRRYR